MPRSKNAWICTFTPQYAFMAWCSVKRNYWDKFTFIFKREEMAGKERRETE
jgi:hypothetical protein